MFNKYLVTDFISPFRQKLLSSEKLDEYLNQARNELQAVKDHMDKEKELKQNDLIKKHGHEKKNRLDEKVIYICLCSLTDAINCLTCFFFFKSHIYFNEA